MMKRAKFILFLFLSLWITELSAQTTKVRGRVTDAKTGEPLPLVSISFVGTTIGITTDFDGYYTIETRAEVSEVYGGLSFLRAAGGKDKAGGIQYGGL